jgi:hypothetical protein
MYWSIKSYTTSIASITLGAAGEPIFEQFDQGFQKPHDALRIDTNR